MKKKEERREKITKRTEGFGKSRKRKEVSTRKEVAISHFWFSWICS